MLISSIWATPAYALAAPLPGHGVEVFSLLRESDLPPEPYIDSFFDTGTEREQRSG